MSYEYRVTWRREHDKTKRQRIYQTLAGVSEFAHFLRVSSWDEIDDLEDYAIEHIKELGNPIEVTVERRSVSDWSEA